MVVIVIYGCGIILVEFEGWLLLFIIIVCFGCMFVVIVNIIFLVVFVDVVGVFV